MAWYPDAIKRDIGRGKYAHTPVRFVLHTAVVNASELKPGAQVAMTASRQADGSYSTSRVTVAKAGAKLPL